MNKRIAVLVFCIVLLPAAATAQQAQDGDASLRAREAHDNAVRTVGRFYDCIIGYVGQHMDPRATALALADAAVAACDVHVGSYVAYLTTSRILDISAQDPALSAELLEQRTRKAQADSQIDGETLKADGRGVGVRCAFELQALPEKAQKKKDEQTFPTAMPTPKYTI
jgi:hypothetical protein